MGIKKLDTFSQYVRSPDVSWVSVLHILDQKLKRRKSVLMPVGNSKRPEGAPSPPPTFAFLARLIGFKEVELNRLFQSMLLSNKNTMLK